MTFVPLLALAIVQATPKPATSDQGSDQNRCRSATAPIEQPCTLPLRVSPRAAAALLGTQPWVWWVVGDQLTLIARPTTETLGFICCAMQEHVEPIPGSDLVGVTVRVPRIDEAFFDIALPTQSMVREHDLHRGPLAPPPPPRAEPLQGRIDRHDVESSALQERRTLYIYTPPEMGQGEQLPVIYLADGATYQFAPVLEAAVAAGHARPAIIVGIRHAQGPASGCAHEGYCDRRNLEYLPHFSAEGSGPDSPFGRHLRFVTDEVMPLIERIYPASTDRQDRIAAGFSSGAVWALSAAARRTDLFGSVIAMSPGGRGSAGEAAALRGIRVHAGAGVLEPNFLHPTRAWAEQARRGGAQVRMREMVSGHTHMMWELLFADAIAWLLPPGPGEN